jgi:DNA-binding NarL/FixJ family response regulator
MEQERARIARDLHDNIGAGLTEIAMQSDWVHNDLEQGPTADTRQRVERIRQSATELARSVDEIVWAINPANDTVKRDVILMDINLPDLSGVECVARISPQLPGTEIIMLTVYQEPETIFRALAAGAHGYLVKPVMPRELLEAIRQIRAGGVPMSPGIAREVVDFFRRQPTAPVSGTPVEEARLGPREQQVLKLLMDGLIYKEIADELGISTNTVGTYIRRIYEKLHVNSRREIISYYRGAGE